MWVAAVLVHRERPLPWGHHSMLRERRIGLSAFHRYPPCTAVAGRAEVDRRDAAQRAFAGKPMTERPGFAWIWPGLATLLLLPLDCAAAQLRGGLPSAALWVVGAGISALFLMALVSRRRRRRQRPSSRLATIRAVSEGEFLRRLAHAFRSHGYAVGRPGPAARRGGVRLVLTKAGRTFLVHCLAWNQARVDENSVLDLSRALHDEGSDGGLLVTCGVFTPAARLRAAHTRIGLIEGPALVELVDRTRATRSGRHAELERREPYFSTPLARIAQCPICASPLVRVEGSGDGAAGEWICSMRGCRGERSA